MAAPLIATKLQFPPPRNRAVERPRLRNLLDRAWGAKLTIISAPAGFGKTTLLAEWLGRSADAGRAVAWLSLDRGDSEPAMFWPHVVAALDAAMARIHGDFPDLLGAHPPDDNFVATLVNQLVRVETPVLLVLDDFHLIEHAEVHAKLHALIEHLPGHVHLVLSTRADPALPLARLRARGDLVEIRAADLRMSAEETATYLNDVMGLALSPADTAILEARTEGWIAALQLAVISLNGRVDPSTFIAEFAGTGRYIVDYLVEEVLQRISPEVRQFLFSTCILRQFNADLCDTIIGHPGGRALIDQLEKQNLFVVPLDDRRQWYRYHHLFADVLMAHVPAEQQRQMPALHRLASEWFEAHGERSEAIHHATASGDYSWAADLLERAVPAMRKYRQEASFQAWMKLIPDNIVRERPLLVIAHAGVLVSLGDFAGIEDRLHDAEQRLGVVENSDAALAHIELYRTALAQVAGDLPAATQHASRVLALAPSDDHLARAGAAGFLAIVSWSAGALDQAAAYWRECRSGLLNQGHVADVQGTSIALADILAAQGRISEAIGVCEEALALGMDGGRAVARGVADTHTNLCMLHLERGDLISARAHLDRSLDLGDAFGLPQHPYRSRVAEARLCIAEGRLSEAVDLLREAERRYVSDFFPDVRPVSAMAARLQIRLGRLGEAEAWLRSRGVTAWDTPSYISEFEHVTQCRILLARGDAEEALGLLEQLGDAANRGGRLTSLIEIKILTALAFRQRGGMLKAIEFLGEAIDLAAPEGHSRVFSEEGTSLNEMLTLIQRRKASPFVRTLLTNGVKGPPPVASSHELLEPLSQRELDVLRLLRSDLSGPELAQHLSVSLNTLRTHTKNIYEKLGVNSRRAAVRRADEMNLFGR